MRAFWLLLALVPGAPAIGLGRVWGGATLLLIGFAGWDLAIVGAFLLEGEWADPARWGGLALGASTTLVSVVWTARLTSRRRRERIGRGADEALALAQGAYLRGDLDEAERAVRRGLQIDGRDIDLWFLDWQLAQDRGDPRRARRSRRRLRRLDLDEKWLWDVEREEAVGDRG